MFSYKEGNKYVKLIMSSPPFTGGSQRSVWGFVNKKTGDILMPAGWKAPAKHARGNIFDSGGGMKYIKWTGPMDMNSIKKDMNV